MQSYHLIPFLPLAAFIINILLGKKKGYLYSNYVRLAYLLGLLGY